MTESGKGEQNALGALCELLESVLKGRDCALLLLFLLSAGWCEVMMAGSQAAVLHHEVEAVC